MRHIINYSGGLVSWATAERVIERHGPKDVTLVFADTSYEDEDLYRFLVQTAGRFGVALTILSDGRTPWDIFFDNKFLGNSTVDLCSRILKRELIDAWFEKNCDPADVTSYIGYDWTEFHRIERFTARMAKWRIVAPMSEPPYLSKVDMAARLKAAGVRLPRMYDLGFAHNNCGGFCIKAGQGHYAHLLKVWPARYMECEIMEQAIRWHLGEDDRQRNVSILKDRTGGGFHPLTLRDLRLRIEGSGYEQLDLFDIGGCNCFGGDDEPTEKIAV